ncbi:MAG TPA: tetratricopeptide repeat protein, partial [Chryseolinea sp.]|nr:tetratricopeptide repeat protein [Chryseolinea sp.]
MRTFTIIVLLIYFAIQAKAQHKELDSLDRLITKVGTDTSRIKLIVEKLKILSNINLDSAITLAEQTLPIARKINYYRGEVSLRHKLATNYCFKGEYDLADEHLDFLETFIQPSKDSSDFADVYGARGMMSGMQSKYDSSIIFYEKAIGILERAGTHKSLAAYYSNIAIAYQQQSNFPEALLYQQKALRIATENKDEVNEAYTTMNMANTYSNMEDLARAEMLFLKAIELAKKKTLINVELYGYSNLASIYASQSRWQQTYEFAIKAASLGKSMGDKGIEAASLSKAATALAYTHKPVEAEAM